MQLLKFLRTTSCCCVLFTQSISQVVHDIKKTPVNMSMSGRQQMRVFHSCPGTMPIFLRLALTSEARSASFIFSSRRRHTRSLRDWSSDVCSSDLPEIELATKIRADVLRADLRRELDLRIAEPLPLAGLAQAVADLEHAGSLELSARGARAEIGRATCRERGEKRTDGGEVREYGRR